MLVISVDVLEVVCSCLIVKTAVVVGLPKVIVEVEDSGISVVVQLLVVEEIEVLELTVDASVDLMVEVLMDSIVVVSDIDANDDVGTVWAVLTWVVSVVLSSSVVESIVGDVSGTLVNESVVKEVTVPVAVDAVVSALTITERRHGNINRRYDILYVRVFTTGFLGHT